MQALPEVKVFSEKKRPGYAGAESHTLDGSPAVENAGEIGGDWEHLLNAPSLL